MPTFPTPSPVTLRIRTQLGSVTVSASDRDTADVRVAPSDPANSADVEHAAHTVVEQHGQEITVIAPETRKGRTPSIEISVELPAGSNVAVTSVAAPVRLSGETGETTVTTASGAVNVEFAATAGVTVASGSVNVERTTGELAIKSASGDVRFAVAGVVEVATASGEIVGGTVTGNATVRSASGDVRLGAVNGALSIRTASGDARIGAVRTASTEVDTASGDIRIGVATGSAAWLDVHTLSGDARSTLEQSGPPADDDDTEVVSIRARSLSGDITIFRA